MADLIAQGTSAADRWRRKLPLGDAVSLGRAAAWSAPWDNRISRTHAELHWDGTRLLVRRVPTARNPIFVEGQEVLEATIAPGEQFVIGSTRFTLLPDQAFVTLAAPAPAEQQAFSSAHLRALRFRHGDQRIDTLSRFPEVLSSAANDFDQHVRVIDLLLTGVPLADAAALVHRSKLGSAIAIVHWDRRRVAGGAFEPSERLIREAIERRESIVHVWKNRDQTPSTFTAQQGVDWAFCTPIIGRAGAEWAFYLAGSFGQDPASERSDPTDLRDDLKFAELAASIFGSLRELRKLEHERASLGQFFSPVVLASLATDDPDKLLHPAEAELSVLFCDLRGFSRATERAADQLLAMLERVSAALGIATRHICDSGGVLGDFHGDAVMGFWGWPMEMHDAPLRAALAALAIRSTFAETGRADSMLADFRVGIGIATGRAVAGKIGTVDQVKVTAFGPAVNLASRLEEMTKTVHAPILIDERTAELLRPTLAGQTGRLRRVARVRPFGLDRDLEVTELLPPLEQLPMLTAEGVQHYERALDEFCAGRWQAAFENLHHVPAEDRVKDFLTMYIVQHNRTAPDDWNGVIRLASK